MGPNDKYTRYGALTGVVSVILVIVGFLIVVPKPPAPDAPAAKIALYYVNHKDAIRVGVLLVTLGLMFYLWFLGSLSSALRAAAGGPRLPTVAFAGGITAASFFVVGLTAIATAAFRPEETSPELTRAINDIGLVVAGPASVGFAVLFGATALVILRSGAFAAWLGWLAAAGAVGSLCALGVIFTDSGVFAADGLIGLIIPVVAFLAPIAALSIVIAQTPPDTIGSRIGGAVDKVTETVTKPVSRS